MLNIIKAHKQAVVFLAAAALLAVVYAVFIYNRPTADSSTQQKESAAAAADESSPVVKLETESEPVLPATESEAQKIPMPDNLKEGMEHPFVAKLQERLMELGFMENDEPTLFYGPVTAGAIKTYQRQNNLTQDGVAGQETLAALSLRKQNIMQCLWESREKT